MVSTARLLTIMGSGETAPTMVKVHRAVLERLGPPPVAAVLLATPFGFQENAEELSQRVVNYFQESLHAPIDIASTRSADELLVRQLRDARYIFAGPGSPSYALRKWQGTVVPSLLAERLETSGALTFSSAAALTIGIRTVPVYEIYKAGEDPYWLTGMDLLSPMGLSAAVIPHYNNSEGGTHDTRFCYLGERRLAQMEKELPENAFVLGVDEHTAITFDLDTGIGKVTGLGVVTLRAAGRSLTWESGRQVAVDELVNLAGELRSTAPGNSGASVATPLGAPAVLDDVTTDSSTGSAAGSAVSPVLASVREQEGRFSAALERRDVGGAVEAILTLEAELTEWSRDLPAGDELDRAHARIRALIVDLGEAAEGGVRDPRGVVGPFVEALLELRATARAEKRFFESDWIRDHLSALGIEVRDTAEGSEWLIT
jgi:hypothetical protein